MKPKPFADQTLRGAIYLLAMAVSLPFSGCNWLEKIKGTGPGEGPVKGGSSLRNTPDAKPSGFFTDRRSDQIEKNLGGDF